MDQETSKETGTNTKMNNTTKIVIAVIVVFFLLGAVAVVGKFAMNERGGKFNRGGNIGYEYGRGGMMGGGANYGRSGMMGGKGIRRGLTGDVKSVSGSNIVFTVNNTDYTIVVGDTTSFTKAGNIAKFSDIQTGNSISVMGASNKDGQILAQRIIIN